MKDLREFKDWTIHDVQQIAYAASFVEFFSEEARRIEGSILSSPAEVTTLETNQGK